MPKFNPPVLHWHMRENLIIPFKEITPEDHVLLSALYTGMWMNETLTDREFNELRDAILLEVGVLTKA